VPVDLIVTPDRVIDCRPRHGPRTAIGICWEDLTSVHRKIPVLLAFRHEDSGSGEA
jgi:5-formyltetrahydrofolate cyclo-ligase